MGGFLPKNEDYLPVHYSNQHSKATIEDLNEIMTYSQPYISAYKESFYFHLQIQQAERSFNVANWRKTTHGAKIRFTKPNEKQMEIMHFEKIIITIDNIYEFHAMMKYFKKEKNEFRESRTPNAQESEKECCLCFDQNVTIVLPCSHGFGAICTSKFIIQKQQKKCPKCRAQFIGSSKEVQKTFYTLIENNQQIIEQPRTIILERLKILNGKIIIDLQARINNEIKLGK